MDDADAGEDADADTHAGRPAEGPHADAPVRRRGPPVEEAAAAVVLCHGRGATADGILELADGLDRPDVAYLAPAATGNTWYPNSFLAPLDANEPHLSSALALLDRVLERAADAVGVAHTVVGGFSQGACLATEYAARNAARYGGVVGFSGGLIGPEGTRREYDGEFEGTPVFLGCSDRDPHIPVERVHETADTFDRMGADVEERIYEGIGHRVIPDEVDAARAVVDAARGD